VPLPSFKQERLSVVNYTCLVQLAACNEVRTADSGALYGQLIYNYGFEKDE
jgi:hypothetical protein